MNQSNNCQNCHSAQQITIAGKNFCANCGTVEQQGIPISLGGGSAPNYSTSYIKPTVGNAPTDSAQAVAPASDIVASLTQSLSSNSAAGSSTPSAATTSPVGLDTPAIIPSVVPADQTMVASTLPPAEIATPNSSIKKFTRPAPATDLRIANAPSQTPPANTATPALAAKPPSVDAIKPISDQPASVGNEISSLDSKDEHVFSDDQFSQLSQGSNERPIDVQNLSQKPSPIGTSNMSDIRPSVSSTFDSSNQTSGPAQTSMSSISPPNMDAISMPATPSGTITPQANSTIAPAPIAPVTPLAQPQTPPTAAMAVPSTPATDPAVASILAQSNDPIIALKKKSTAGSKAAKAATVVLTMAGLVLLGAYVWQVNYPNLALKVASSKAGINASIPGYLPSGWQVSNNIISGPGSISYQLNSADGKASATVNQSKTDWDSQALAENYVSNKSDKYLSLQAAGLTIYVYGNQASWVNNGTWYRIEGSNTSLNQDQLIRMATSL